MSGNGPLGALATAREYAPKSKYLIYVYHENDLMDLEREKKTVLVNYLDLSYTGNLREKQDKINKFLINYHEDNLKLLDTPGFIHNPDKIYSIKDFFQLTNIRKLIQSNYDTDNQYKELGNRPADMKMMRKILLSFLELAKLNEQEFVVVFAPASLRYHFRFDDTYFHRGELINLLRDLNINLIDFNKIASRETDYTRLYDTKGSGHYNQRGYELLSEQIYSELLSR